MLVAVGVSDPGNLGTLLRSAEASGCAGVVCCGESVDVYNPKVVRASAGAVFGIPIVAPRPGGPGNDPVAVLDELARRGPDPLRRRRRRRPRAPSSTSPPRSHWCSATRPTASPTRCCEHVDGLISIPMAGAAESLNVAMAGTVLAFEAARQRRG